MGLTNAAFKVDPLIQFKVDARQFIPKSLAFAPPAHSGQGPAGATDAGEVSLDLLIFAYIGGSIFRLDQDGRCIQHITDGPEKMSSVCMMRSGTKFLAYTGDEFELIDLAEGRKCLKVFSVGPRNSLPPKHAVFNKNDTIVVCGTDEGYASVFDVSTSLLLQRLESRYPYVQHVAAFANSSNDLVALSGTDLQNASQVDLFRRCHHPPKDPPPSSTPANPGVLRRQLRDTVRILSIIPICVFAFFCFVRLIMHSSSNGMAMENMGMMAM
ncbi:hypothetical protein K525DRAFT_275625 [Schizophyllum commune Loenen D]|nr:hypothetical protein K525DRAFT_275625 [Schizophyllum commune Loenen D]